MLSDHVFAGELQEDLIINEANYFDSVMYDSVWINSFLLHETRLNEQQKGYFTFRELQFWKLQLQATTITIEISSKSNCWN